MAQTDSLSAPALRWSGLGFQARQEWVVDEAPLGIEVAYARGGAPIVRLLGITMRTPGHDEELALGFLHAEGVVAGASDVIRMESLPSNSRGETVATQRVTLGREPADDLARVSRSLLTSSACGLCGRAGLEGLPLSARSGNPLPSAERWPADRIAALPDRLREAQVEFARTGGSHAAGLAGRDGRLLIVREDVGRHNAVDKVVGAALRLDQPLAGRALVLSGRASFELVQKAAAAGIALVVAVGAPSALAVRLAAQAGVTLVGFVRQGRFNVYTEVGRIEESP